jgi:hypothetical protein
VLAAFAALALLVVTVSLAAGALHRFRGASPQPSGEQLSPEVSAFLGPLASGAPFGAWHVAKVEPSTPGRMTLRLERGSGEHFVVDVLARSPAAPPGIAETARLAIYLRTERGAHTPEAAMDACNALAAALRAREQEGHEPPLLDSLVEPSSPR